LEDVSPSTHNMDVPKVDRYEYALVNIDGNYLNLINSDGDPKDDVMVPKGDLGNQIQTDVEAGKDLLITVVSAIGEEHAISCKESPSK
jgi:translation initiation factor 5A